jgi:hypothetical protein
VRSRLLHSCPCWPLGVASEPVDGRKVGCCRLSRRGSRSCGRLPCAATGPWPGSSPEAACTRVGTLTSTTALGSGRGVSASMPLIQVVWCRRGPSSCCMVPLVGRRQQAWSSERACAAAAVVLGGLLRPLVVGCRAACQGSELQPRCLLLTDGRRIGCSCKTRPRFWGCIARVPPRLEGCQVYLDRFLCNNIQRCQEVTQ